MGKFGSIGIVAIVAAITAMGAAVVSIPAPVQVVSAELSGQLTIAGSTTLP